MKVIRVIRTHLLLCLLSLGLTGCNTTTVVHVLDRQAIYQSTPYVHLEAGNYTSTISAQQFKNIGNLGIGVFENFDGDAILVNGSLFQTKRDGKLVPPPDTAKLLAGSCMLFDVEKRFTMRNVASYAEFQKALTNHYATNITLRALQVQGTFNSIRVSCNQKQAPPCKPFSQAIRTAQEHVWKEVSGTLVGFWIPPSVPEGIMPPGFHLVFISEDQTKGGRVLDFESDKLIIYFKQALRLTVNYAPNATTHVDIGSLEKDR
jgi:acetolactate decarboxylase